MGKNVTKVTNISFNNNCLSLSYTCLFIEQRKSVLKGCVENAIGSYRSYDSS